jgi:Domain of unknown function (DUF4386)
MKAARLFPLAGIAAPVLFVIAFAVGGEAPSTDDSVREIVSFYRENDSDQIWAAAILTWGTLLFVLFVAGLWRVLRDAEPERRGGSALVLIGVAIYAVGATIFASLAFTAGDIADDAGPGTLVTLNALGSDAFFTVALGVCVFLLGAGTSIIQTAAVPKWIGWVAVVIAVVAVTPAGFFAFLAMGVWLLIMSVLLWMRGGATPAQAAP